MPSWWQDKPLAVAIAILFVIVFCRAQATYWLARGLHTGSLRNPALARRLTSASFRSAAAKLHRYGAPLIPLSFLTIGFQTLVNAAAGASAMTWRRYTAWMIPGCIAWAVLYATVGMAIVLGWIALAARQWWLPWLIALTTIGLLVWFFLARRRSAKRPAHPR